MTIKTKFLKEDFDKILSNYNIGQYKFSKPFKEGSVQTNYLLVTDKGKFAFRCYENRFDKYILFELLISEYLNKYNYPTPLLIKDIRGNLMRKYKEKPIVIFSFIEGKHPRNPNFTAYNSQYKEVSKQMAILHRIIKRYRPKYWEFSDKRDKKSCLKEAISNSKKIKSKLKLKERLSWLKSELNKVKLPNSLPKGICHGDFNCSNLLFDKNKLTGLIDFDNSCYIYLIWDLANMIYFWAWPPRKKLDFETSKKLVKDYNQYRKLTMIEKRYLYDALKMVSFMSIAWFIYRDKDFCEERERINCLNLIGRDGFYKKIFP